jgi:hypothetical protein
MFQFQIIAEEEMFTNKTTLPTGESLIPVIPGRRLPDIKIEFVPVPEISPQNAPLHIL